MCIIFIKINIEFFVAGIVSVSSWFLLWLQISSPHLKPYYLRSFRNAGVLLSCILGVVLEHFYLLNKFKMPK